MNPTRILSIKMPRKIGKKNLWRYNSNETHKRNYIWSYTFREKNYKKWC